MVSRLHVVCVLVMTMAASTHFSFGLPIPSPEQRSSVDAAHGNSSGSALQIHHRVRRQNGEVVESIFQIPIQTLLAVSKVFTTSIQSFNRYQQAATAGNRPGSAAALVYNRPSYSSSYSSSPYSRPGTYSSASAYTSLSTRPRASAASVAGVGVQADGSSYRI